MAVRPARRQGRLPDRMTRFMLFLAHGMDYPPAGIRSGAALPPLAGDAQVVSHNDQLDGRDEIVDVIMWWQARCWRGIQAGAAAGDPAMVMLRNDGAVLEVQAAFRWVAGHRAELEVL